jgi:DNA-binding NarL/FixJ family response regulator
MKDDEQFSIIDAGRAISVRLALVHELAARKSISVSVKMEPDLYCCVDPDALDALLNGVFSEVFESAADSTGVGINLKLSRDAAMLLEVRWEPGGGPADPERGKRVAALGLHTEKAGGTIVLSEEPDGGACFRIALPIHTGHGDQNTDERKLSPRTGSFTAATDGAADKPAILLVDDNLRLLNILGEYLSGEFSVFTAVDGRTALERLERMPRPELVISDIMMENMDGFEFYDLFNRDPAFLGIPFIFLTAKTRKEDRLKGLARGAVDYIQKPFAFEELSAKALAIIRNREAQKESNIVEVEKKLHTFLSAYAPGHEALEAEKLGEISGKYDLSRKEMEVLLLLGKGLENKEISSKLNISLSTAKKHILKIFAKCGVHTRVELVNLVFPEPPV